MMGPVSLSSSKNIASPAAAVYMLPLRRYGPRDKKAKKKTKKKQKAKTK